MKCATNTLGRRFVKLATNVDRNIFKSVGCGKLEVPLGTDSQEWRRRVLKGLIIQNGILTCVLLIAGCAGGGVALPDCEDGVCSAGEHLLCPLPGDCGEAPPERCGNGFCGVGENDSNCRADCEGEICQSDRECDDGRFCNGAEECIDGACFEGDEPCTGNEACDESEDACKPDAGVCFSDEECDDRDWCTDDICDGGECLNLEVLCSDGQFCNPDTGECQLAACGNGACDPSEDAEACPDDCEAVERFLSLTAEAEADRAFYGDLGLTEVSRGATTTQYSSAGDRRFEQTEVTNFRAAALDDLVMSDNAIGKVFPGSFLWAEPIRQGRLHAVDHIPGRPPVTTSFTLLRDVEPRPTALTFEHDGRFSSFLAGAADVFDAIGTGGTRIVADFKISQSLKDALLSVGVSAGFWGSSIEAGLTKTQSRTRTAAVMSLDQVFYSAAVDAPTYQGYLPEQLIREDAKLAAALADEATEGGEIVYVRKVDYGRRILVALTAEATEEELNAALHVTADYLIGSASVNIDHRTSEIWNSVEGKLILIGGSFPQGISGFFGGDLNAFKSTIQTIMSADFINDTQGGVPVSFELAYASDNSPMQVFETLEFAGTIPGKIERKVISGPNPISMDGSTSRCVRSDCELDPDDYTVIRIDNQLLSLSPDSREIRFDLVWSALEGNAPGGGVLGTETVIQSYHSSAYSFEGRQRISEIVEPRSFSQTDFPQLGNLNGVTVHVGDCGFLKNIRVVVDGPGGSDHLRQRLNADLWFQIWLVERESN